MSFKKVANLSCRSPCMKILRGEILHLGELYFPDDDLVILYTLLFFLESLTLF